MIKEIVKNRTEILLKNIGNLVIDGDTHITEPGIINNMTGKIVWDKDNYFHGKPISAEDLISEMKMADVDMCLTWQNPAATIYPGKQEENYLALKESNRYIFESDLKYPAKFIPSGWIDPEALGEELAAKLAEECVREFGFPIVKMNPAQNGYPIDSDIVLRMTEKIISLGAIPAFHYGADTEFTPAEGLQKLAESFPESPIIAIHMGGGGASYTGAEELYHESRKLGLEQENIYFVLSAKRDTHIESDLITYQLAGGTAPKRLICASDAPYGRQTWNYGGFRKMFESLKNHELHTDPRVRNNPRLFTDKAIQGYLGKNLAELAIKGYQSILSKI